MNLKSIMITGILATALISVSRSSVNAASNAKLAKEVNASATKMAKTNLIGQWYQMDSKHQGMVYSIAKDGSVDWHPIGGTGNNTLVTDVKKVNGWMRLTLTYVTGGSKYGFFKTTNIKINHQKQQVLLLNIKDTTKIKQHDKFTITTKAKVVLPPHQRTINAK